VNKLTEENNIKNENLEKTEFQKMIEYSVKSGGVHVVASKGHGKSRLMFSMARELAKLGRLYIFDGSETWLYGFDSIPTFTVEDRKIMFLGLNTSTLDIERYSIRNWVMVERALAKYPVLLFRLKTRKPSKRGFFVRQVINYLDGQQRINRESTVDNEASSPMSFIIEEAQDCFNSRSTSRLESEEFLTVFNEARNQREAFFTASQRLTDFSKTIRTKQVYCLGRIGNEDTTTGLKRIEKQHNIDLCRMPVRTWFIEGLEKLFLSPDWKQNGKPFQIPNEIETVWKPNAELTRQQKPASILKRLYRSLFKTGNSTLLMTGTMEEEKIRETKEMKAFEEAQNEEQKNQEIEDEEDEDFIMLGDDEDSDLILGGGW